MSARAAACPLCGGREAAFAFVARDRNREITGERFTYERCGECGTLFMRDVPDDLGRYYAGEYHRFDDDGSAEWMRNPALQEVESFRVRMLARHAAPGTLIDVGAGPGGFTHAALNAGFDVTAIEMDARCCEFIEHRLGARAVCSDQPLAELRALPRARVVALWHVLEHLREPGEMIAAAAERLEPGGVLALGVPNPGSLQFRLLGPRWFHLDAPRHLCLMPELALVGQAARHGLRLLESTTADPFGFICALHGWLYAMRRNPARSPSSPALVHAASLLARATTPLENARRAGPALTLLFAKPA